MGPSKRSKTTTGLVLHPSAYLGGKTITYSKNNVIFSQGDTADTVLYIRSGEVKVAVVSRGGRRATISLLHAGDFFGEGCMAGQKLRTSTAFCTSNCVIDHLNKDLIREKIHSDHDFAVKFSTYLLGRNAQIEADLTLSLFHSVEYRLAEFLITVANTSDEHELPLAIPKMTHDQLAEFIGATRAPVSKAMNRFRRMGYITYNSHTITVFPRLVDVLLSE